MLRILSLALDVYSIIICFVLAIALYSGGNRKKKLNKIFIWMCFSNIFILLGDIPNWTCEGFHRPWYPAMLWLGSVLLWVFAILLLIGYTNYVYHYLLQYVRVHKAFLYATGILSILYLTGCFLSQFNGMFYYIDAQNIYHRGEWYLISQVLSISILLLDTAMIYVYRKHLCRKDVLAFFGYIILPIIAVIIQFYFYGLSLTYAASTLALLIIFINIQSEQELRLSRMESEHMQNRISIMLSQIQPHFLYNALNTIHYLCRTNPDQAADVIQNFSCYLRGNMDSLTQRYPIPFEQELSHLENYLAIERLRFPYIQFIYDLSAKDFVLPALTLQPIVENAIHYGVTQREDETGTVTISSWKDERAWYLRVDDNGIGFDPEKKQYDKKSHIGISNTRKRLESMCGGELTVQSTPGIGTVVMITIPKDDIE